MIILSMNLNGSIVGLQFVPSEQQLTNDMRVMKRGRIVLCKNAFCYSSETSNGAGLGHF